MKRYVLYLSVLLFSCKKDNTKPNDNPTPVTPTVLGSWTNNESTDRKPTFKSDSVFWSGTTGYPYKISNDTLYRTYPSAPADPQSIVKVSAQNDSLFIHSLPLDKNTRRVFWRVQ